MHLLALIFACIFFGYAMVNSLVFYRRARRVEGYSNERMGELAKSRGYGRAVWISGIVGAIGFAIASWKLLTELWRVHAGF
jgi:hypothetical protein